MQKSSLWTFSFPRWIFCNKTLQCSSFANYCLQHLLPLRRLFFPFICFRFGRHFMSFFGGVRIFFFFTLDFYWVGFPCSRLLFSIRRFQPTFFASSTETSFSILLSDSFPQKNYFDTTNCNEPSSFFLFYKMQYLTVITLL